MLDLDDIEDWPRSELVAEARRAGVWAPGRLSDRELIRRVRHHHRRGDTAARRARKVFGRVLAVARAFIAPDTPGKFAQSPDASTPRSTARAHAKTPASEVSGAALAGDSRLVEVGVAAQSTPELETKSVSGLGSEEPDSKESAPPKPRHQRDRVPRPAATGIDTPGASRPHQASGVAVDSEDSAAARPGVHTVAGSRDFAAELIANEEFDAAIEGEPIPTRTMAKLLSDQGHYHRALAIYRKLLIEHPGDETLQREAHRVQQRRDHRSGNKADPTGDCELVATALGGGKVLISWRLSARAVERAVRLLPPEAKDAHELRVRAVLICASGDDTTRVIREHVAKPEGEWILADRLLSPDDGRLSSAAVAVGLAWSEHFVSVAHAPPVEGT